jgi:predicted DNA-binding transcriptional regulator AlpA
MAKMDGMMFTAREVRILLAAMENPGQLLTVQQVAERYTVNTSTIWRWAKKGLFPAPAHIGGATRWRLGDLILFEVSDSRLLDVTPEDDPARQAPPDLEWTE